MSAILEKFVEAELFHNPMRAYFNGFKPFEHEAFGRQVQRLRQVQLEPYGIADIVNIFHADQEAREIIIQVIECKRDIVNLATYAQAKRYLSALKVALRDFVAESESLGFTLQWECVLVGHRLDKSSDFVFVLNDDDACSVYTYQQVDGELLFAAAGRNWGYDNKPSAAHVALGQRIRAEAVAAWGKAAAEFAEYYATHDSQGAPL